ncbi:MAG: DNA repair protein RecN [Kiritimatiellae bacterium]|nr:DNA repair protein RecN [Kiritimatiellia bacterium]
MLSRLSVSNLAVVERAEAVFASGLNVLTGETGAGKSVLMGALGLVLGGRADASVVRDGAKEARVEAVFDISARADAVSRVLDDAGLPECENGELIVRRVVGANGSGRVWVNDAQTTVATLKRLGAILVDIHGPRSNQQILDERFQRDTLDAYGGTPRADYDSAWRELVAARAKLEELESAGESEEEMDLLRYQVNEFEEAALSEDDEDLAERHAAAAHAEEIVESANAITDALGGDGGAADALARLAPVFASVSKHFPEASAWAEEAERLTVGIEELSRTVADAVSRIDADPEAFAEMDARLGVVNRMKRKYGKGTDGSVAALLAVFEEKKSRLASLENRGEELERLRKSVADAEKSARTAGAALTKRRAAAAEKLAKAVTKELVDLGFLKARFSVRLEPADPAPGGCDRVSYMFEPNPGESARPLAAIASSGEAARVMLALKKVLAAHDSVDVLVFDEIDANIGGETGRAVGEKMRSVAAHRQVIAITHLPQSAVYGDRHLVVSKSVSGGRTRTRIEEVSGEARVAEVARMLGGDRATGVVRTHAEELLKLAR